jgi:hypothetical protein
MKKLSREKLENIIGVVLFYIVLFGFVFIADAVNKAEKNTTAVNTVVMNESVS